MYDNVLGDLRYTGPAVRSLAQLTLLDQPGEMTSQLSESMILPPSPAYERCSEVNY